MALLLEIYNNIIAIISKKFNNLNRKNIPCISNVSLTKNMSRVKNILFLSYY